MPDVMMTYAYITNIRHLMPEAPKVELSDEAYGLRERASVPHASQPQGLHRVDRGQATGPARAVDLLALRLLRRRWQDQ